MIAPFRNHLPVKIRFGDGVASQVSAVLDEEGAERQGGEQVSLVYARRQREERHRDHQRADNQTCRVVAARDLPQGDQGGSREEHRPDQLPGDRSRPDHEGDPLAGRT